MSHYDDCIVFLLAKGYQKAHAQFKNRLQVYGLTPVQHLILEAIGEEEGLSAGDIAKRVVLDNATVSGVLDRLAENGWVVKQADENDKRYVRTFLTPRARERRPLLLEERKQANDEILRGFTLEEKVLLKRLLRDLPG
jgi:DNA-binding MarR family transcriptional regulator